MKINTLDFSYDLNLFSIEHSQNCRAYFLELLQSVNSTFERFKENPKINKIGLKCY